jgi:Sulfotransferase family
MFPISAVKQPSIRTALNAASIWRFIVLFTLISCWGTLGTFYFFFFSSLDPQRQQNQTSGGASPPNGPPAKASPWFSTWFVRRADGARPRDASCGEIKTAESSNTAADESQKATTVSEVSSAINTETSNSSVGPELSPKISTKGNSVVVQYGDSIYLKGDWDGAPVVVEKYKLIFFTVPKVGCTAFKQLLRRMEGHKNWDVEEYDKMLPWNPSTNGLKYLYDYSPERASEMMTSKDWTRAIFVREPKSRLLSAYLDKAFHNSYVRDKCCSYSGSCVAPARASLDGFLKHVVYFCDNAHWKPQHKRMEDKYWPHVNFVGQMETIGVDARRLLEKIGAWNQFGASGWGPFRNGTMFGESSSINGGQKHATEAAAKLRKYYSDPTIIRAVESYYDQDYQNPYLSITKLVL